MFEHEQTAHKRPTVCQWMSTYPGREQMAKIPWLSRYRSYRKSFNRLRTFQSAGKHQSIGEIDTRVDGKTHEHFPDTGFLELQDLQESRAGDRSRSSTSRTIVPSTRTEIPVTSATVVVCTWFITITYRANPNRMKRTMTAMARRDRLRQHNTDTNIAMKIAETKAVRGIGATSGPNSTPTQNAARTTASVLEAGRYYDARPRGHGPTPT